MKPRVLVVLLIAALAALVAGCGSSSSSGGGSSADPAKLAPATAPLYVEATVRPEGQLGDDAKAAVGKLLHTDDPGGKVAGLVDRLLAKDHLSWNDDFKPWLGQRVGLFITSFAHGNVTGAAIADANDTGKAEATLDKLLSREGRTTARSYKGVDFRYSAAHKSAAGIVDGFAVIGSWSGVQQVVDTAKGGRPITDVPDFTSARSAVGADQALASVYANPQAIVDAVSTSSIGSLSGSQSTAALAVVRQLVAKAGRAVGLALHANGDGIRLEGAGLGTPAAATGPSGADQLAALPGDAWLALGVGDLGGSLKHAFGLLSQLAALGGNANQFGTLFDRFQAQTGIDIQKDLLSWMGPAALYGRGHGITDLGVVFTVKSKNPAKSHRAVGLIANALRRSGAAVQNATVEGYDRAIAIKLGNLPFPFVVAAGGDRFSLGLNPQALTDVLHPSSTLGDSPQYQAAVKALGPGMRPAFLLDTPTIVNLIESFGVGANPQFAQVKPYLDALGPLAAGIEHDGDTTKLALALALR